MTTDESSLEDGTLNFWAIPDIHIGLDWLGEVGMDIISLRVQCLTGYLIRKLMSLHHADGRPMTRLYGPENTENRGGTVAFNLLDSNGQIFDNRIIAKESAAYGISLRTGCFCNPGVGETAFGVTKSALEPLKKVKGDLSMEEILEIIGLSSFGAIRVSLGIASTVKDVDLFLTFAEKVYKDRVNDTSGLEPRSGC
jgi:selenocysteine lyase/cysteine desulfurase